MLCLSEMQPSRSTAEPEDEPHGQTGEEVAASRVAGGDLPLLTAPTRDQRSSRWGPDAMVALVFLSLLGPWKVGGFVTYDCAKTTNQVGVYSLLEPADCQSVAPHHAQLAVFLFLA
jgi:hypothetical protein